MCWCKVRWALQDVLSINKLIVYAVWILETRVRIYPVNSLTYAEYPASVLLFRFSCLSLWLKFNFCAKFTVDINIRMISDIVYILTFWSVFRWISRSDHQRSISLVLFVSMLDAVPIRCYKILPLFCWNSVFWCSRLPSVAMLFYNLAALHMCWEYPVSTCNTPTLSFLVLVDSSCLHKKRWLNRPNWKSFDGWDLD